MRYLNAFALVLLLTALIPAGQAYLVTVDMKNSDGGALFCQPCHYAVYNSTGTAATGKFPIGSSSVTLNLTDDSEYAVYVKPEIMRVNLSEYAASLTGVSGDRSVNITVSEISGQGKIALVLGAGQTFYGNGGTDYNKPPYSYSIFKNITKALGFISVNSYNGGSNYSISSVVISPTAFDNYDMVLVSGTNNQLTPQMSDNVRDALKSALAKGVKVFITATEYKKISNSSVAYSDSTNCQNPSSAYYEYLGFIKQGGDLYPNGLQFDTFGDNTMVTEFRLQRLLGVCNVRSKSSYYGVSGVPSDEEIILQDSGCSAGAPAHVIQKSYMKMGDAYVVPTVYNDGCPANYFSPVMRSMLYGVINGFELPNATDDAVLKVDAYEGTQICSAIKPLAGVLCCFQGDCETSSALSSAVQQYSSLVLPVGNPEITASGDAMEKVWFWGSADDFFMESEYKGQGGYKAWEVKYEENAGVEDTQFWLNYQDENSKQSRVTFAGTRGSTNGYDHYLVNYDFYDTYQDTSFISEIGFSSNLTGGSLSYQTGCIPLTSICQHSLYTCEGGDKWNMTMYQGVNETHFREYAIRCSATTVTPFSSYVTAIPGFNTTEIEWYYGYAPDFMDWTDEEIGVNDNAPLKKIQSNKPGGTYNWIRQLTVVVFSPQYLACTGSDCGDDVYTDTGGYIEVSTPRLSYEYVRYKGGNISIDKTGTGELECTAPPGYYFRNDFSGEYSLTYRRNITVNEATSVGVKLERMRPMNLKLHITSATVEDIDNARCSIQGFTDSFSTNGYCYFGDIKPNTEYNVTVSTIGAEAKTVSLQITVSDYYDSYDADKNSQFCGNFDGNYTYEVDVDTDKVSFTGYVVAGDIRVNNAIIDMEGFSCKTGTTGSCAMKLPLKYGGGYGFTVTKKPNLMPFAETVYNLDCDKNNVCSHFFYAQANLSNPDGVNGDTVIYPYDGGTFNLENLFPFLSALLLSPLMFGMYVMVIFLYVGFKAAGGIGSFIGATGAVLVSVVFGFIPLSFAFGYFLVLAVIFAGLMKAGILQGGD
jgi:hypothetical protein